MVQVGFSAHYRVLKVVEIEGRLEKVPKIQRPISLILRGLLGLYRCKTESGNVVDG